MTRFWQWSAYYQIENETPTTSESILAHLASLITNYLCRSKYSSSDFLPSVTKKKKEFNKKEGANFFRSLTGMLKGKEDK